MPTLVISGAGTQCTFGMAPGTLMVLPTARVTSQNMPAASIMDNIPMTNVMPFGMCNSPSNPQVAAATTAASGVLTPQPCIPVVVGPWTPGATKATVGSKPALPNTAKCNCSWGGVISITNPGQTTVSVT
jgi:hypothetical protein